MADIKFTSYFETMRMRADRKEIQLEWILFVIENPEYEMIQSDGRIRRWARIPQMDYRWLRVILLSNGQTVHNAFFDRSFKP